MHAQEFVWITRWPDFQHYKPERDRAPAWIKCYTRQLDDSRYLDLSTHARGLLHDLRMAFARAHGELPKNTRQLSHRVHSRVTTAQLEALNHAGFIEFVSREVLEHRLELLYSASSPRARGRARIEGETEREEQDQEPDQSRAVPVASDPARDEPPLAGMNGNGGNLDPHAELPRARERAS